MLLKGNKARMNKTIRYVGAMPESVASKAALAVFILALGMGLFVAQSGFATIAYALYFALLAYGSGECVDYVWIRGSSLRNWYGALLVRFNPGLSNVRDYTFFTNPYVVGLAAYFVSVTYALVLATWVAFDPRSAEAWMVALLPLTEPLVPVFPVLSRAVGECAGLACADRVDMYRHMLPVGLMLIVPFVVLPLLSWRKNFLSPRAAHGILGRVGPARQGVVMSVLIVLALVLMTLSHLFIAESNLIDPVSPTAGRGSFGLDKSNYSYAGVYISNLYSYYISIIIVISLISRMYRLFFIK